MSYADFDHTQLDSLIFFQATEYARLSFVARRDGSGRISLADITTKNLSVQRLLIILGLLIAAAGVFWPWLSKLPIGRLPGDVVVDRPGFKLFAPFTTMIIVSLVVSVIVWLLRR
jgi:Protein of unknown function (DUF2905)